MKVSRCFCLLLLIISLSNPAAANKTTGLVKTAATKLANRALLLGTSLVLACGLIACDEPNLRQELFDAGVIATPEDESAILKIGMSYDGTATSNPMSGAQLAVDQINAAGGIHGLNLQLVARDNLGDSVASYVVAEELVVDERIQAFIGSSTYAQLVAEVAHRYEVPMLTTIITNSSVTASGNYIFMAAFSNEFQGQELARFARNDLEATRAAIISQDRKAYARTLAQHFTTTFGDEGGNPITVHEKYLAGTTNFTEQLRAVALSKPDVVFVAGITPEVALIVKQGKAMGIKATFIGADGWASDDLLAFGGQALNGSFFLDHFSATNDQASAEARQFIADYAAANGGDLPSSPEALAYDAVRIIAQALERAGSIYGDAIRDEIAATEGYSGATQLAGYTDDRQAIKSAVINSIKDGKIIFYKALPVDLPAETVPTDAAADHAE
ncbi:MAG: ABC transporter substrate-binding protein [Pseudomonadota bacterium]|nr:ABC transporter substrate-binding protein [Pseudomonadota bacterium]